MARLLADGADYLGCASMNGKLYRIDWYPGLVACDSRSRIGGDLYRMHAPGRLLALLDDYEECTPDHPPPHEFRRAIAGVLLGKMSVSAWTYFYNRPIDGLETLEG